MIQTQSGEGGDEAVSTTARLDETYRYALLVALVRVLQLWQAYAQVHAHHAVV